MLEIKERQKADIETTLKSICLIMDLKEISFQFREGSWCFVAMKRNFSFLFTGSALKCYRCESSKSWVECKDSAKNIITCSAGQSQCGKVFKQADQISTFARGCLSAKQCRDGPERFEICRKAQERGSKVTCQMSCCSSDLCNGAAHVSVVRVLTLLTCALVATVVYASNIWSLQYFATNYFREPIFSKH